MSTLVAPRPTLDDAARKSLQRAIRGPIVQAGDPDYNRLRQVWNAKINRKPVMIVRCTGPADVIAALRFAREQELEISVRSTGHNVSGCAVCDGGLMIDLSLMKGVRIDPVSKVAWAQAGVTWGEFDHETQAFALATTGGRISTTGIAGLTLGGGYGWLMRECGLAIDNLRAADVVLADGRYLTATSSDYADLFWGLRGGGGNFGIATALSYDLHTIGPVVTGGWVYYPAERAKELLEGYRAMMANASDQFSSLFNFFSQPPPAPFVPSNLRGKPVVAIAICHTGSKEAVERDCKPLRDLGPPLIDLIKPMPYTRLQKLFDAAGAFGYHVYTKSGHLPSLNNEVIDRLLRHAPRMASPLSIVMISSLGGAVSRIHDDATAFSHRQTAFDVAINAVWENAEESASHVRWVDDFWQDLSPLTKGRYVNEMDDGAELGVAYHEPTLKRLSALKQKYDPENIFKSNPRIVPIMASV